MSAPEGDLRPDAEETQRRGRAPRSSRAPLIVFVLLLACAGAGYWWWTQQSQPAPAPVARTAPSAAPASAPAPGPAHYPLVIPEGTAALTASEVQPALVELFGRQAVDKFLDVTDFPRRVVATIDNLGRASAPVAVWPVHPTAGRFEVDERPDGAAIAAANANRYAPVVDFAEKVDAKSVVALYRRMYPLLQSSYRELGLGNRDFNDRVIEVIDLLLATPVPSEPPRVRLTEVKGPYEPQRPWVRYQYVDPALESLAAGQKILVRVGPAHEQRLKRKLRELRSEILAAPR